MSWLRTAAHRFLTVAVLVISLVLLGGAGVEQAFAQSASSIRKAARKAEVGGVLPIPLQAPESRKSLRLLIESTLSAAGKQYVPLARLSDPLGQFKETGDPSRIPDPRSGGRGNNANDRLTNSILAWLLFDDDLALEQGILIAEWLAATLDKQDQAHVQRHPSLALAAIAVQNETRRQELLAAFVESVVRLQGSRFWIDSDSWKIGMAGVRPFLRAVGAAHRFVVFFDRLQARGLVTTADLLAHNPPFVSMDDWLNRVGDRLREFCLWRKVLGDTEPRGWQTSPGEWHPGLFSITFWPYLDSRVPAGRDSTWFHYGQIYGYEMATVKLFAPHRFEPIFEARAAEIAEWSLDLGSDLLGVGSTGKNVISRRNWFFPTNPRFELPFRQWTDEDKEALGEQVYCLLPCLSFIRSQPSLRQRAEIAHMTSSQFATFPGEVSWSLVVALWLSLASEK